MSARRFIDIDELSRYASADFLAADIAKRIGFPTQSVYRAMTRHNIQFRKAHIYKVPRAEGVCRSQEEKREFWIKNHDRMVKLRGQGLTAAEIALEIGTTKNSVIGRMFRTGMCTEKPLPAGRRYAVFPPPGRCQFPHGDPGKPDFHFCGEVAKFGSAYCADHHARCFYTPRDRTEVNHVQCLSR